MINESEENKELANKIELLGWMVFIIEGTDYLPSFAYTVGLWKTYKHPELIMFGLKNDTLHTVLNDVGNFVKIGENIETNKPYKDFFDSGKCEFIVVQNAYKSNYFRMAIDFYKSKDFPALQLVWTDRNDKFPWEEHFEEVFLYRQPLLDRNTDFKFREERNLAIFTTRQWLDLSKPILTVVHDEDGNWQFLTNDQLPEDAKLVALEEIIKKDITLNEVFDLDYGERAERDFIGEKWKRAKSNDHEF